MRKLSKIEESAWGDMRHRSSGKQIRREDNVNLLDFDGFYEYLQDHYVCTGISSFFHTDSIIIIPFTYLDIVGKDDAVSIMYVKRNVDTVVRIVPGIQYKKEDLFKKLQDNFSVDVIEQDKSLYPDEKEWESKIMNNIKPKDGSEVTNKFVVEVLDFIIDNIDNPKDLEIGKK